jgi:hypothetical protein
VARIVLTVGLGFLLLIAIARADDLTTQPVVPHLVFDPPERQVPTHQPAQQTTEATAAAATTPPMLSLSKLIPDDHRLEGPKDDLVTAFNADRKALGKDFRRAVLAYVAKHPARHSWVACFLTEPEYLQGNEPQPEFALLLLEQGIVLSAHATSDEDKYEMIRLQVLAALLADKLGLSSLAVSHKAAVESSLKADPLLGGGFPALDDEGHRRYDSIKLPESK